MAAESLEVRLLLSATSVDRNGRDIEVDSFPLPTEPSPLSTGPQGAAPFDLSQTFQLNSRPTASKTIYLDFNGHTTAGTWWNSGFTGGAAFTSKSYSVDGDPAFSDAELEQIQYIWQRVAEDFAPFDVNVTTQDPGVANLVNSGSGDTRYGVRVIIGGAYSDWFGSSAGGVAYLSSFGASVDTGVFVFSENLANNEKYVAEAISHEVGHSLGLSHDGAASTAYYSGHGSGSTGWAPIMGVGYYREVTQWSRGQYSAANNTEDDLFKITSYNGFDYRIDDYGSSQAAASTLATAAGTGSRTVNVAGVIERNTDQDWSQFTTTGGALSLTFSPAARGANLDIEASLYNSAGQRVASSNPADQLGAGLSADLAAGTYFIMIDGVGARGVDDGYSDYGSLGQYSITGSITENGSGGGGAGAGVITGRIWHDADGDGVTDVGDAGLGGVTVFLDANANGVFETATETSTITGSDGGYSFTGLDSGNYRIVQVVGTGWQQISPTGATHQAVSLAQGQSVSQMDFRNVRPPVLANVTGNVSYKARSADILLATTGTVADADTVAFTGGRLTVSITSNGDSADRLAVRNEGTGAGKISVKGSTIRYGGVIIGTVSGGSGKTPLSIQFNASASTAAVNAVLRNITYRSTAKNPTLAPRAVQFVLQDGSGGVSTPATRQVNIIAATKTK